MQWLDEFIKPRKAKSNIQAGTKSSDSETYLFIYFLFYLFFI